MKHGIGSTIGDRIARPRTEELDNHAGSRTLAVTLSAFEIDSFPVTNADFAAFIAATTYRTEAEAFGW
jgi:formylglycine-generating enzyme required for sulfatase activity